MTTNQPSRSAPVLAAVPLDHPGLQRRVHDWNDRDQTHKATMSLFREDLPGPQAERRATSRILYRVELSAAQLLIQAATPPVRTDYGIRTTTLTGLLARLTRGCTVRITVDINAVRCQDGGTRRIPVPDNDLADWLAARLSPALVGITILAAPITVARAGRHPLRIAHITADATVSDTLHLQQLVNGGVGRAKAYGCGLLTVLPTG